MHARKMIHRNCNIHEVNNTLETSIAFRLGNTTNLRHNIRQ